MISAEILRDALMRLPAVSLNAYFFVRELSGLQLLVGSHPYWGDDIGFALSVTARVALVVFLFLLTLLHLTRRRPVLKHETWRPKIEALMGVVFFYLLFFLPRADPGPYWDGASSALILFGNILCVLAVSDLGRSLSLMPEARKLVTGGIYRLVRHPLYLSEALAMLGAFIQYRSSVALVILLIEFYWQIRRMGWEERILARAFPEYEDYSRTTARLIPGVY